MTLSRQTMAIVLYFIILFGVFFYFFPPNSGVSLSGGDLWELYHDTFYRSGIIRPFDIRLVTQNQGANAYYTPLGTLFFNSWFSLFGSQMFFLHLFCMMAHCVSALLLYSLVRELTEKREVAVLASGLFLFHPANLKTISVFPWSLDFLPVAFFYLISLRFFVRFLKTREKFHYLMSLFAFFFALLSKFSALTLIPTIAFLDLLLFRHGFRREQGKGFEKFLWWWDKYLPFVLLGILLVAIQVYKYPTGSIARNWGGTAFNTFSVLRWLEFLAWLIFPFFEEVGRPVFLVTGLFALTLAFLFAGDNTSRFLTLWLVVSLGVFTVSNFRESDSLYRYLYLPSLPFSILVSTVMVHVAEKVKSSVFHPHAL